MQVHSKQLLSKQNGETKEFRGSHAETTHLIKVQATVQASEAQHKPRKVQLAHTDPTFSGNLRHVEEPV